MIYTRLAELNFCKFNSANGFFFFVANILLVCKGACSPDKLRQTIRHIDFRSDISHFKSLYCLWIYTLQKSSHCCNDIAPTSLKQYIIIVMNIFKMIRY